jgi:hypothetical protein
VPFGLYVAVAGAALLLLPGCDGGPASDDVDALVADIQSHGRPSIEYVADLARSHDVVLLGEYQLIQQDVAFVHDAVPALHAAGVRVLGVEYACAEDQSRIDAAVTNVMLDTRELTEIQRRYAGGTWAYQEYLGLYTAVWQLNRDLPADAEKMRVIGLSPYVDWEAIHTGDTTAREDELQKLVSADAFMAAIIQREVDAGQKVVALMGTLHALTDFTPPAIGDREHTDRDRSRCGHILAESLGDGVVTVLFHQPLPGPEAALLRPAGGALDGALAAAGDSTTTPLGFDLAGTAVGALPLLGTLAEGLPDATLADLADGYVYHAPFAQLRGATVIHNWIQTSDDLAGALATYPDQEAAAGIKTVDALRERFALEAGIRLRFDRLR